MTRLLRSSLLVLLFLSAGFAARAQVAPYILLQDLNAPVACLCGPYSVGFTFGGGVAGPFEARLYEGLANCTPRFDAQHLVASSQGLASPITINVPCTLDTTKCYFLLVVNVATGLPSNTKPITVQPFDNSPVPFVRIDWTPRKEIYCPKDTVTFFVDSLVVARTFPPPTYQWFRKGVGPIQGANRDRVQVTDLKPNDCVWVQVTKGNFCAGNAVANSDTGCLNVKPKPTAVINQIGSGCADSLTNYRLDTANVGPGAIYKWYVNGVLQTAGITLGGLNFTLQPGQAACRDQIKAKIYTFNPCTDSVTSNTVKVQDCGRVRVDNVVPTSFCAGDTIRIDYSTVACFDPTNVFTFQLSDASGSFASPTAIGSVVDSNGGSYTALVPSTLEGGTGYLLRIISSNPTGTSLNSFGPLTIFPRPGDVQAIRSNRCGPGAVTVRVTSTGATSFAWYTAAVGGTRVTFPNGTLVTTDTFTLNVSRDTTFYVEAINANGCRTVGRTMVPVRVGTPLQVSAGPTQTVCQAGPCVQLIGGSPTGGVWSGIGVSGSAFCPDTLAAGNYTVQYLLEDRTFGCKDSATKTVTIRPVPKPTILSHDTTVCKTSEPVSFMLMATPDGGTWAQPALPDGTINKGSLAVGPNVVTYSLSTPEGCTRSDTVVITATQGPNPDLLTTSPLTCNTPTGTVTVNPINIIWDISFEDAAGNPYPVTRVGGIFSGFSAGAYVAVIDDHTNCITRKGFVIQDLLAPHPNILNVQPSYCTPSACVSLTADSAGGRWFADQPGVIDSAGLFCPDSALANSTLQIYYLFRDIAGCVGIDTATTLINALPPATPERDTTVCQNSPPIVLSGDGVWSGSPALTVGAPQTFLPGFAGVNTGTVPNVLTKSVVANGCTTTVTKNIFVTPVSGLTLAPAGPIDFCQGSTVTLTASLPGGNPPGIAFTLLSGNNTAIAGSADGTFSLTTALVTANPGPYRAVSLVGNCSDTSNAVTVNYSALGYINPGNDTSVCRNALPFDLGGIPANGDSARTTRWEGEGVMNDGHRFNAAAVDPTHPQVNLLFIVTRNSCSDTARRIITMLDFTPAMLTPSANTSCQDSILLTASPTGPGLSYIFSNGTVNDTTSSPVFIAHQSGTYTVTVTSMVPGVCPAQSSGVTIQIDSLPAVPTLTALFACKSDLPVLLPCPTSSPVATWTGTAGEVILGSCPVATFDPAQNTVGAHTLTLTVFNGACSATTTLGITVRPLPRFTATVTNPTACGAHDGTLALAPQPFPYIVNLPDHPLVGGVYTNFSSGSLDLTVTDSLTGCSADTSLNFVSPGDFQTSITNFPASLCYDAQPLVLDTSHAAIVNSTSTWYLRFEGPPQGVETVITGPIIPSNLTTGRYRLRYEVRDASGCLGRDTVFFNISNPETPVISPASPFTLCSNATVTLSTQSVPGRTYQWFFNGTQPISGATNATLQVSQPGAYSVQITELGCTKTSDFFSLSTVPAPVAGIAVVGGDTTGCQGETITLVAATSGTGLSYQWRNGTTLLGTDNTQAATTTGIYTLVISNGACKDSATQGILINPLPRVTAGPDRTLCASSPPVQITGFSPAFGTAGVVFVETYINGDQFNPGAAGTGPKTVTLRYDSAGCSATATATYSVVPGFNVTVNQPTQTFCPGTPVTLTATVDPVVPGALYTYQWYYRFNNEPITGANGQTYVVTQDSTYYVIVTIDNDPNGCRAQSVPVSVRFLDLTVDAGPSRNFCANDGPAVLRGTPGTGVWSGDGVDAVGNFIPATATLGSRVLTYTVSQGGCSVSDTVTVTVFALPTVAASYVSNESGLANDPIDILQSATVTATGASTYVWTPDEQLSATTGESVIASPTVTKTYTVTGTLNGCSSSAQVTVVVRTDVRVANGFSPNGDDENDVWNIFNIQAYPNADIRVYNRWGALVYKANGTDPYWDGSSGGKDMPVGTYYYTIDLNNNQKPFIGSVTLVR